ncbi:MAG: hypothetical protein MUF23_04220, partial [Pirellula sp.]|nr:hypothetical protein [Pirellula sp.]
MQKRLANRRKSEQKRARTRFLGLIERLEERLPLTGPYVNAPIAQSQAEFLLDGARGLSGVGDRIDQSGDSSQPLGPFKNRDGTPVTPGLLGPFGRTLREELENPIDDFFDATPVDQRTTDALVAHLGSFPAYLSIEGGLVDGTIDELVFDVHIQREYELSLLNIEFDSDELPTPFYSKNGIEANLTAVVDFQLVFGISLDPSLNSEQAFFLQDVSMASSIRADSILHPFTVNFGFLEASVPDVVLAATLDLEYSQPPSSPTLRLTEVETLEVNELFSQRIGSNDFHATFNLDVGIGRWRLEGSTYLQAVGDFLGFEPAITFSPNFDEVFLFNHISSDEVVAGMEYFQSWLTSWGNSSQYDVKIPFSKDATAGSVFNAGQAMSGFTDSLRDEEGNPSFDNAADFPYAGNGIDYNPATNKLTWTVLQNLPGQQVESRSTRVELDDTVGLDSQTEAVISGGGTVSFVISIDLSQENIDFRDRIAIENLRVRTFYGTEAVVLTGNAAFGGLGIAFANGVLSGEISTEALFRSTWNGSPLTLRILNDTIDIASQYLRNNMQWDGNSVLRLPSLLVSGNLFQIASDAFVEVSVVDIQNSIYETTTNVPDFWNFASLAFEDLTDTLSEAILGTESWDSQGDEAVATLGVSLDDFGPLKQDRIVDAITQAVENADTAVGFSRKIVQDVSDFVEELDVPTTSGAIDFVSDVTYDTATGIFSWFVDASADEATTVNTGLGFESLFGYTSDPNVEDTSNVIGDQTSLQALTTSRLQLGLEFDPPAGMGSRSLPGAFLNSRSRLDRTLYINHSPASGSPVTIEGASGALGLRLQNGSVVIAQNLASPDPTNPAAFNSSIPTSVGRVRISDLPTYQPQRQAQGRLLADFEVVPDHTGNPEPDRLTFRTLQFGNPSTSTTLLSSPDFSQMRQGLDLQVNLDALVPSLEKFFEQLEARIIDEVLDRAFPLIGDKLDEFANFIDPLREAITTALDALSSFRVSDIENAIETALRNLFNRPNRDFVQVDIQSPSLFKMTLDINDAPISVTQSTRSDLGLPALGIDWTSDFSVLGRYGFQMTFVLDVNEGFYVETDTESIQMTLDMNMVGQATGKLGFFEVIATAEPPLPGQSAFHAEYVIDVTEPSGDDKLFLNEIGTGPLIDTATSGLSGEAHMSFSIEAAVNAWLPSIETGLRIDWEFDGIGFSGQNPPEVTYEGIQLHLGRLLNDVFLPFFETIQDVFAPMQPIIDILTQPLPVISDFADPDPTILDLALLVKDGLPEDVRKSIESLAEFVATLATINDIVQAIQVDASTGLSLQLGDIAFGGVASPQFDARMSQLDRAVLDLANETSDLRGQFDGASGAPTLSASLNSSPGSLHLPIIENPLSAIGWILGVDEAELITWDLPKASVSFPIGLEFPIFPGILASIFGGLEVGFDFKVGLDTAGFEDFAKSRDFKDLFNGFYVSDRANADGTGADVNEIFVRGDLLAGAGAGAGVGFSVAGVGVSLIVGGGVFSEVGIDLIDHDKDGKVRGRDFASPDGCFALNGEFGVALEARAKAGIFKFELPITEATLAKGRKVISCPFYEPPPPTILAGLDSATGTLTLFIGPEAHQRNVQPNVEEESFSVLELPGEIIVSAFGKSQSFASSDVRNIVADGGTKDDRISMLGVTKPSILRGGEGDDVIVGGESTDVVDGGTGRDELYGGGDNDILVGGIGADLIYGEAGDDDLYGNEGDDDLYGGIGHDEIWTGDGRNVVYGDAGNDTIFGGNLRDVVYGGEDDDTIDGGAGPDVLNGDSGVDTIRGREGDDLIDGGSDGDFLYGDEGDDRLWGRGGVDELYGGIGLDYLNGNEDGDVLYGQGDADEIDGDSGDDQILGGPGADILYGRAGFDTIEGGNDHDIIYGGADGDTISGGRDVDEIYGEAGNDTISGGEGDDLIDGGNDSDTIYGYEIDRLADSLASGVTDNDTLHGGRGFDRIAGGPGDDRIYGDQDADILLGNEGADIIEGNDGADTLYGFHFVSIWSPVSGGTDLPNRLFGNQDNDEIYGGPEPDFIRGNAGDDTIDGNEGSDEIFGD